MGLEESALYLAILASAMTILAMAGGAARALLTTGISISRWAADKWFVIGRVFAAITAALFALVAVLNQTATNGELRERLKAVEEWQRTSTGYSVRLFNMDDVMSLEVNGTTVLECVLWRQDSCFFTPEEFKKHLHEGENRVAVSLDNHIGPTAFGYEVRRNGVLLYAESCGYVIQQDTVHGCETSEINGRAGTELLREFVISMPKVADR